MYKKRPILAGILFLTLISLYSEPGGTNESFEWGFFAQGSFMNDMESVGNTYFAKIGCLIRPFRGFVARPSVNFDWETDSIQNIYLDEDPYTSDENLHLGGSLDLFYEKTLKGGVSFQVGPGFSYDYSRTFEYDYDVKTDDNEYHYIRANLLVGVEYRLFPSASLGLETGLTYEIVERHTVYYDSGTGNPTSDKKYVYGQTYMIEPRISLILYLN